MKKAYRRVSRRRMPKKKKVNGINIVSLESRFMKRTSCTYIQRCPPYFVNCSTSGSFSTAGNTLGITVSSSASNPAIMSNGVDVPISMIFSLATTQNYSTLTQAFDKYRIAGIKFRFKAQQVQSYSVTGTTYNYTNSTIILQRYTTSAANTTYAGLLDNQNEILRFGPDGQTKDVYKKPSPLNSYQTTAGQSAIGYSPQSSKAWISCIEPFVQHSGINFVWSGIKTDGGAFLEINVEYLVELLDQV